MLKLNIYKKTQKLEKSWWSSIQKDRSIYIYVPSLSSSSGSSLQLFWSLLKSFLGFSVVSCPDDGSLGGQPINDIQTQRHPEAGQVIQWPSPPSGRIHWWRSRVDLWRNSFSLFSFLWSNLAEGPNLVQKYDFIPSSIY